MLLVSKHTYDKKKMYRGVRDLSSTWLLATIAVRRSSEMSHRHTWIFFTFCFSNWGNNYIIYPDDLPLKQQLGIFRKVLDYVFVAKSTTFLANQHSILGAVGISGVSSHHLASFFFVFVFLSIFESDSSFPKAFPWGLSRCLARWQLGWAPAHPPPTPTRKKKKTWWGWDEVGIENGWIDGFPRWFCKTNHVACQLMILPSI